MINFKKRVKMAKNVILLGGSNSVKVFGLQAGFLKAKANLTNLALGGSTCMQSLYAILHTKNQQALEKADLIVTESNINDIGNFHHLGLNTGKLRIIDYFYENLYKLNKKVLILLLPFREKNYKAINNIHKLNAIKYGFNLIDMQEYYKTYHLQEFGERHDKYHQFSTIMNKLSYNIVYNIDKFKYPNQSILIPTQSPKFKICKTDELIGSEQFESIEYKNSMFNEKIKHLNKDTKLYFPKNYEGCEILAFNAWNNPRVYFHWPEAEKRTSSIILKNKKIKIVKASSAMLLFQELKPRFLIDKSTFIQFNKKREPTTETSAASKEEIALDYFDLIDFFLVDKSIKIDFSKINLNTLENEKIKIPNEYDFTKIIPPIETYKEIIDEYCACMDVAKLAPLQNENANLKAEIQGLKNKIHSLPSKISEQELANLKLDEKIKKLEIKKLEKDLGLKLSKLEPRVNLILNENLRTSAVTRIRNHLAYRLGAAIIVCNKSLFGICGLPFVLSFIKANYKKEQSAYKALIKQRPELKLPNLETYPDYQAALKEKACLTYKLGEAMMRADKAWYKGGYVKFYFEAKRLEKEFKNKKD